MVVTTLLKLLCCVTNVTRTIIGLTHYATMFGAALLSPKAALAARVVALQSQLAACRERIDQKRAPRPRFTQDFRRCLLQGLLLTMP